MTDEHDPDSQPMHEEDTSDHMHPVQAPVDDFSDPGSSQEETATISQESANEDDDSISVAPEERSRSLFPLFIGIIGVLIVGGGLVYWQFGGASSAEPAAAIEQAMVSKSSHEQPAVKIDAKPPVAEPPASTKIVESAPTRSADASAPAASATASGDINALYKPTVEPVAAAPAIPPGLPATDGTSGRVPSAAVPSPTVATVPAPQEEAVKQSPSAAPILATPDNNPVPVAGATVSRIDTLSSRIDELQKSLDQATKQLTEVTATQSSVVAASRTNADLEERLNKIEQGLTHLERTQTTSKAVEKSSGDKAVKKTAIESSVAASQHKPPKAKKPSGTHQKHMASKARKTKITSSWVLRAATPSEAWVSANATSPNLRHIQVGDSLPGVGKIKAISQSSNGWEILGAEANIK